VNPALAVLVATAAATVAFWAIGAARRLRALRAEVLAQFRHLDARLQDQLARVESLLECARTPMRHEHETLDNLARARAGLAMAAAAAAAEPGQAGPMADLGAADVLLAQAQRHLLALAEAYPDLRDDARVQSLAASAAEEHETLAYARQGYNTATAAYNAAIGRTPARIVARALGLRPATAVRATADAL